MNETILQLGVGGAVALGIVYLVLQFLGKQRAPAAAKQHDTHPPLNGSTGKVINDLQAIRSILDARDSDGTPLVFVPRSLSVAIADLADATKEQNQLLTRIAIQLEDVRDQIKELHHQ